MATKKILTDLHIDGNVGIGTTTPAYKLDIDETTSGNLIVSRFKHNQSGVASAIQLENRAGSTNSAFNINWGLNTSGNQGTIGVVRANLPAAGGSEMYFKTSYGEVMRLDGNGNVGVGTDSPGAKLDVVGYVRSSNTEVNATTKYSQFLGRHYNNAEQDVLGLATESSSSSNNIYIGGGFGSRNSATAVRFYTASTTTTLTGTERMRIDSAGNVGIGTDSPNAKLEVSSSDAQNTIRLTNTDTTISTDQEPNAIEFYTNDASASGTGVSGKISQVAENPGNQYGLAFSAYNLGLFEAMRIDQGGNVGIGTTTPSGKLEVNGGSLKVSDTYATVKIIGTGGLSRVFLGDTTDEDVGYLEYNHISNYFRIGVNAAERMRIDSSGNVGIGTVTPSAIGGHSGILTLYGSNATALVLKNAVSEGHLRLNGADFRFTDSGGNARMQIETDTGNVGIGTTTPNNELEVLGSNSPRISLRTSSETVGESLELGFQVGTSVNSSTNTVGVIKSIITQASPDALKGDLVFQTNSGDAVSTKMIIKDSGNVGIGTTTPTQSNLVVSPSIQSADVDGVTVVYNPDGATNRVRAQLKIDNFNGILELTDSGNATSTYITANGNSYLNGGNVGIGTTTPGEKLEVNGNILATGTVVGSNLSGTNTGDQDLSVYALLTDITGTNSGTNTGDQDLSSFLTSSSTQSKYLRSDQSDSSTGTLSATNFYVSATSSASQWVFQARNNASTADSGIYFDSGHGNILLRNSSNVLTTRINANGGSYFNGDVSATGSLEAASFVKTGGTSSQFLKADGSVDSNTYVSADEYRKYYEINYTEHIALSDESTALTTGTSKVTFRSLGNIKASLFRLSCNTAPTGSVITVDINVDGVSILSTKLTIDAGEKTSRTAASTMQFATGLDAISDDAEITVDIDGVGSTIAGAGLKLIMYYNYSVILP